MNQWVKVAIGLGTNLGEKAQNIEAAIKRLEEDLLEEPKASAIYESEPWGIKEQPKFYNAVVVGLTEWKPPAIVNYLKALEREMGRKETIKNGPRLIDLDLLIYGEEKWDSEGVVVPHPGLPQRSFVLLPLVELWADWKHPELNQDAKKLLTQLPSLSDCRKLS